MKPLGMNCTRLLAWTLGFVLIGCSSGGGGDDGGGGILPVDATGTWDIQESITGNCPQQQTSDNYTVTVTQSGNSLTVTTGGETFQGTVNGNVIGWTGSYSANGGRVTVTSMSLTVVGDSLSGTAQWTWTDGSVTCSGSTQVAGTRTGGGGGDTAAGTWEIDENVTVSSGPCQSGPLNYTIQIAQSGASITVTGPGISLSGTIQGSQLTWSGSYPDTGGTTTATMNATFSGNSMTGTSAWSWTDGSESCTGTSTFTGNRTSSAMVTSMFGDWRWREEVIRAIGESPWQIGDCLERDFEIAMSGGEIVVRIEDRELVAHFDWSAGQLTFRDAHVLETGELIEDEHSIVFDMSAGYPVGYGLREWTLVRDGRIVAGGTNSLDGERVGHRVTVVGSSR